MFEIQPIDNEREAYLAQKRAEALVVSNVIYETLCRQLLGIEHVLAPAKLHAQAFRLIDDSEIIIIDQDQFKSYFGQDLTPMIPYTIEHEAQELWLTRGNDTMDPYGPAHYEAIRQTLMKAYRDGNLDAFLNAKRLIYKTFEAAGDTRVMSEWDFYKTESAKLIGR